MFDGQIRDEVALSRALILKSLRKVLSRQSSLITFRMALRAQSKNVVLMVLRQGLLRVATGIGIGAVTSLMLTRLLTSFLYGVTRNDPVILIAIAALLALTALAAAFIPVRKAARIDPMVALRSE